MIGLLRGDRFNTREATFSFDQGQQATAAVTAHHQVDFPIADPGFLLGNGWPIIDRHPVGNGPFIGRSRCGTTRSKAMPEIFIQATATYPVGTNMLVDTFMENRDDLGPDQPIGNLLRTPLMAQFALDQTTARPRPFE